MAGLRSASEPYAALLARTVRERHGATWGLSETGAAGPTGNRYGDPAGHTCIAIAGPSERALTFNTGSADRRANMRAVCEGGHGDAARCDQSLIPPVIPDEAMRAERRAALRSGTSGGSNSVAGGPG